MSKMIKINERFERLQELGENDIYRKFSEQFDNLFNSEEVARDKEELEYIYVNDVDFEEQIERFRYSSLRTANFCVGYTGIGKTTSIRYCFGLGVSNEACIDKKRQELVFPTFLDNYQISDIKRFDLRGRIAAVCSRLEEEYDDLRELMRTEEGKSELHNFIRKYAPHILENINPVVGMDLNQHEKMRLKLNGAYKNDSLEFQANLLKFYIYKKQEHIKKFIIILDDIETLPEAFQEKTIKSYLKLLMTMQKTDYSRDNEYNVKLLISVRPHTYRILNKTLISEAYTISKNAITKKKRIDLNLFFQKRFDYYTSISQRKIGNLETWKDCYQELMNMNSIFSGKYKEMIQFLCFMNIREALASYSRVFANRFWVQKNRFKESAFSIVSPDYNFNNINVIRALACNEEQVFWGDDDAIIPNIFYTTQQDDYSIYCLLVLKYFWNKKGFNDYGINADNLGEVMKEWEEIFGKEIINKFDIALRYLFKKKVLRKSIKDFDDLKTLDLPEYLNEDSLLYISPRGNELYEMFSRDSVLLEMLRESAWRDYEGRDYSTWTSSELMMESKQIEIFKDLFEYIDYLSELEQGVLATVKVFGTGKKYKNAFTDKPVVLQLLKGVKNSLDYSGIINQENMLDKYIKLRDKIDDIINKI